MAKCKNCINLYNLSDEDDLIVGKWCPKITDSPDIEVARDCKYFKAMSQADRIRAMSDEELAEFLPIVTDFMCRPTKECRIFVCNHHGECTNTKECAMKWLQSEVEE